MDKILEKLGVYDLIGVMFSGLIILLFTRYICVFLNFKLVIDCNDTFQLLIISYFIGLVFQEIGSRINCWKILKSIFTPVYDLHISLSQKEVDFLFSEAHNKMGLEIAEKHLMEIYNFCKLKNNIDLDSDRKQSLGGMARSLMLYFFFAFIMLMISFFTTWRYIYLGIAFLCLCFGWLFYNRYVRFMKMKYVNILRGYCFNNMYD